MKKIIIVSSIVIVVVSLTGCSSPKGLDEAYITALESLIEEADLEYDIEYISLFINDGFISARNVEVIKEYFQTTYDKRIYTYTPDEVRNAGPYGKEKLSMDGMFLYLLYIQQLEHTLKFETAKYHTVRGRGALGLEVVMIKEGQRWIVQQEEVLWRE